MRVRRLAKAAWRSLGARKTRTALAAVGVTVGVAAVVQRILGVLESCRAKLLDLADADAGAYAQVGAAYGMPRGTDEEKAARQAAIQEALKAAARVPLAITEACVDTIVALVELREKANPNLLSDVACSADLALAALRCACLNVDINLAALKNGEYVAQVRQVIDGRLYCGERKAREVFGGIAAAIREARGR